MKYFELISLTAIVFFGLGVWFAYMHRLKRFFYRAMLVQAVMKLRQKDESLVLMSDYILSRTAEKLTFCHKSVCRQIFNELLQNNYTALTERVKSADEVLGLCLLAHFAPNKAEKQLGKMLKKHPDNNDLLLLSAMMQAVKFNYSALEKTLKKIKDKKLNALAKAEFMLLQAKLCMYKADMAQAVKLLAESGRIFKKHHCGYGESEVYFVAGEIYRVCAISDVSQMMFETAGNIAADIGGKNEAAKSVAAKGMLTAGQNRFAEAADFFAESRKVFHQSGFIKSEAEVINQQALLFVMQNKPAMAVRYASEALNMHRQSNNKAGMSQSSEIISMATFRQKKYAESLEYALAAQKGYLEAENYAAYFDAAFLEIQALFMQNWLETAEKRCFEVLQAAKKHRTNFYIADIYGFLGTIYMRLNNWQKAKQMFCRSVKIEVAEKRDAGAASDYANLALIESKLLKYAKSKEYAAKAKEAAERTGDENLIKSVCKQIESAVKV